jgi:hypothetical protein
MTKQTGALKTVDATSRRHQRHDRVSISLRLRQRSRLRIVPKGTEGRVGCEITVIFGNHERRFELHRELRDGRARWFAVAIVDDQLHDIRPTRFRWQALMLCNQWACEV